MKVTCPRCGGAELLNNLDLVQSDLYYSRGHMRNTYTYPLGGFPALSCDICKGQGWVTSESFPGALFTLHQTPDGFWVILDLATSPLFEGHFADDSEGSGFVVIRTDLNQGWYPTVSSNSIVLL